MDEPDAQDTAFPPEAWNQVTIETQGELALYGARNRSFLELTVVNASGQALDPAAKANLALSYRLLDSDGTALAVECPRTPLTAAVAPGTRHHQRIEVIVPQEHLEATAAIRVGLLLEGEYWVDSLCPAHARRVTVDKPAGLTTDQARCALAGQIWGPGTGNGLRWPYGTIMVAEAHKLMYIPIAKCACTSLKSMMLRLAGVERAGLAVELGVHFVTDRFNTGVQLKDKPLDLARDILASGDYFKFSVIREPFERLVSAYLEKFVYKRKGPHNLVHTLPVMRAVQGSEDVDLQRGISFDQFVHYILQQDPFDLDTHWRPQHLYLLGVPHFGRNFRLEDIDELESYLRQQYQVEVTLGHQNRTVKSDVLVADAATLVAGEFDDMPAISPDSFAATRHADAIRDYYRKDFDLYRDSYSNRQ